MVLPLLIEPGMKYVIAAFTVFFVGAGDSQRELKVYMHQMYGELHDLRPYIVSDDISPFKKNIEKIKTSIAKLEKKTSGKKPKPLEKSPELMATFDALEFHLKDTLWAINANQFDYAQVKLKAIPNFCLSCHSRIPDSNFEQARKWFYGLVSYSRKIKFEDAEYYFVARKFGQALDAYSKLIARYPNDISERKLEQVFLRKILIYSRVLRDPALARASLQKDLKNQKLPNQVRRDLNQWIEKFHEWQVRGVVPSSPTQIASKIHSLVEKHDHAISFSLANESSIDLLQLTGQAYEHVLKNDETQKVHQLLLYALARAEIRLKPLKYYSLPIVYLKKCMDLRDASLGVARKCFQVYENRIRARFSSRPIPDELNRFLLQTRKDLYPGEVL